MVVVKELRLDFPGDHVSGCLVVDGDWEVATLVEAAELCVRRVGALGEGTGLNREDAAREGDCARVPVPPQVAEGGPA